MVICLQWIISPLTPVRSDYFPYRLVTHVTHAHRLSSNPPLRNGHKFIYPLVKLRFQPPLHQLGPRLSRLQRGVPRLVRKREDALPNIQPLLLLRSATPSRRLEAPCQDLLEPSPQHLEHEHRLPVPNRESRSVAVQNQHARVELGTDVAAQQRDGKGVYRGGFVGVQEPRRIKS